MWRDVYVLRPNSLIHCSCAVDQQNIAVGPKGVGKAVKNISRRGRGVGFCVNGGRQTNRVLRFAVNGGYERVVRKEAGVACAKVAVHEARRWRELSE